MRVQDFLSGRNGVVIKTEDSDSSVFVVGDLSVYFSRCGQKVVASISSRCDSILSFSGVADDNGYLSFKTESDESTAMTAIEMLRAATATDDEVF